MPSKLKKVIEAVKDKTSISLAKVSNTNASNVEVLILKATRHDEAPVEDRYVNEILQLISSSKVYAAACTQVISKRIGKTRNWIVALKSLMLVLRIFQDGDPYFPREVVHAMKRGNKILNLSNFRDDSKSSPWDYTAFVRTFALYLDERLDCYIAGKLQRRFTNREKENGRVPRGYEALCDMKPIMLLDSISNWQRLLDRAMGSRPTGSAKNNKLVQISLYSVVEESFDLYRDISDALALLLDNFFHLQYQSCVSAFQACVRASKQFEELCSFYDLCKSIGVGRTSEYPSVQKVSEELLRTLQEFLKDQASFPVVDGRSPLMLPTPLVKDLGTCSDHGESWDQSTESQENISERESEHGSHCTSLEDLMSGGTSPSPSIERLMHLAEREGASPSPSVEHYSQTEQLSGKPSQQGDIICAGDTETNHSSSVEKGKDRTFDILCFDDWPQGEQKQDEQKGELNSTLESTTGARDDWELVLFESATQPLENLSASPTADHLIEQASSSQSQYNPFLEDATDMSSLAIIPATYEPQTAASFVAPTFQAFKSWSPNDSAKVFESEDDPFGPCADFVFDNPVSNGPLDQQMVLQEQQLWLQNQNKIIDKYMT